MAVLLALVVGGIGGYALSRNTDSTSPPKSAALAQPTLIVVPFVEGLSTTMAEALMSHADLGARVVLADAGQVANLAENQCTGSLVVNQSPTPESKVPPGTIVSLSVCYPSS
jgi:PASTA domain